ncbi:hypothetical protein ABT160_13250 [Streptomyces sp. NPDC001941]|uniref:hypothetical protein n=1 Tax=Streptomyces sp. NPDC001941 TaxID=3154659 RepID=UPI00331EEF33
MDRDLRVDTGQLARFSHALDQSLTSLAEARRALEHARADALGTRELDEACDGFQRHWARGAEELGTRIGAVQDGVRASAEGFAGLDRAIEEAFRGLDAGAAGGPR